MARLFRFLLALFAAFALTASVAGAAEQLCIGQDVMPGPDGRLLGHLPYAEAAASTLVPAPAGFALGQPCKVDRDMAPDLARMLAAAHEALGAGGGLRAVSCFRSIAHQRAVFCSQIGSKKRCANAAERARAVGPPGHSEHHSGYAIDFGTRPSPGCGDAEACFAMTPAGRWLLAHGTEYGFELSFPPGNAQGVTWEPWHWRWVGTAPTEPGADRARMLFARARADFPADPAVPEPSVPATVPEPSPAPPHFGPPPPLGGN